MMLFKIRDDQRWKIEFNFLKKIRVSSLQCVERFNCVLLDYIVSHMGPKKNKDRRLGRRIAKRKTGIARTAESQRRPYEKRSIKYEKNKEREEEIVGHDLFL